MNKKSVLIVDDDLLVVKFLRANLLSEDYNVLTALDGNEALQVLEKELPDLIILDLKMPDMDGYEVCRRIRQWSHVPILILSALNSETDKVKCLDAGADDYLVKPFGINELMARIRAVFRRTEIAETVLQQEPAIFFDNLEINFSQRRVSISNNEVKLTQTEYCLLMELAQNAGKVLTHTHLLQKVWGPEYAQEIQYLHVYIRRLRQKLEDDPSNPRYIVSIPGVGYQLKNSTMN
jgi:two-component system KDP operon response regulator KdpE